MQSAYTSNFMKRMSGRSSLAKMINESHGRVSRDQKKDQQGHSQIDG
jgi:hypothetical protein